MTYSQTIFAVKIILPAVAILLIIGVFALSRGQTDQTNLPFSVREISERLREQAVANPLYIGSTQNGTEKGDKWVIKGHKWYITGAEEAAHFILVARTSDDSRKGLTAFLFHKDQPGWHIKRRIPIMGPEEHGGHCELIFDGLEIPDENRLLEVGDGLKVTQIRLGPARLTHCMRWLGLAKRCMEIAADYTENRYGFGLKLADRESVQIKMPSLML